MPDTDLTSNFKVTPEGLIVFKSQRIAFRRPNSPLIILADARKGFSITDHAVFDALIVNDTARRYITSFEQEFDWNKRVRDFQSGTIPDGVKFTPAELGAMAALESAKAKIKAAFGLPEIPYTNAPAIDVNKIYGANAEAARRWIDGGPSTSAISNLASYSPEERNLARIRISGKVTYIDVLSGYKVGERTAKKYWKKLKEAWARTDLDSRWGTTLSHGGVAGYDLKAFPTYVKVGCQSIPRAEIERIAALRGWDNPTVPA